MININIIKIFSNYSYKDSDIKVLKEIHRTLKKNGNFHLMVEGTGGLIRKFVINVLRPEYKNNRVVKNFLTKIF